MTKELTKTEVYRNYASQLETAVSDLQTLRRNNAGPKFIEERAAWCENALINLMLLNAGILKDLADAEERTIRDDKRPTDPSERNASSGEDAITNSEEVGNFPISD